MKKLALATITLLSFSNFIYAQPLNCPDVREIRRVGVSHNAIQDANGKWYTGRLSNPYGTAERWTFGIGGIEASTINQAILRAQNALQSLQFVAGPIQRAGRWGCLYSNNSGYLSGTVTPPLIPFNQIKNYIN